MFQKLHCISRVKMCVASVYLQSEVGTATNVQYSCSKLKVYFA